MSKKDKSSATLDDAPVKIRLQLSQEKLEQAKLQMEKARIRQEKAVAQIGHTQAEFDRYEKARKEGLVSDKEVATYKYKLEELKHDRAKSPYPKTKEFRHKVSRVRSRDRAEQARLFADAVPGALRGICHTAHRQYRPAGASQ